MDSLPSLHVVSIKIPVSDLAVSRRFYTDVFALREVLQWPDEDGMIRGVALAGAGDTLIALREDPAAASAVAANGHHGVTAKQAHRYAAKHPGVKHFAQNHKGVVKFLASHPAARRWVANHRKAIRYAINHSSDTHVVRGPKGAIVHVDTKITKPDGTVVGISADRGTITAIDGTKVTLGETIADGTTQSVTVDAGATVKVRVDGKKAALTDLAVGQHAIVIVLPKQTLIGAHTAK